MATFGVLMVERMINICGLGLIYIVIYITIYIITDYEKKYKRIIEFFCILY